MKRKGATASTSLSVQGSTERAAFIETCSIGSPTSHPHRPDARPRRTPARSARSCGRGSRNEDAVLWFCARIKTVGTRYQFMLVRRRVQHASRLREPAFVGGAVKRTIWRRIGASARHLQFRSSVGRNPEVPHEWHEAVLPHGNAGRSEVTSGHFCSTPPRRPRPSQRCSPYRRPPFLMSTRRLRSNEQRGQTPSYYGAPHAPLRTPVMRRGDTFGSACLT